MKIKELTKEIMNIVVPEKEIEIVSPKASRAFIKALSDSKKVSKFLNKLPDYIEASQINEEERIAMLTFIFAMDESIEKEFKKMKDIFKDKNPDSQNTRKDIARIIMSPMYNLEKVVDKMSKKSNNENKKVDSKEEMKHNEKVKKNQKVKDSNKDVNVEAAILEILSLVKTPNKVEKLINESPEEVINVLRKMIPKGLLDKLASEAGVEDKETAIELVLRMLTMAVAIISNNKEYDAFEKWLSMFLEGKTLGEMIKAFQIEKDDVAFDDSDPIVIKKLSILTSIATDDSIEKEINKVIDRLEEIEDKLTENYTVTEQAAGVVHDVVNNIKKGGSIPNPETIFNESSHSLKLMVENGSLHVGETYVGKVGSNNYTIRLTCKGKDNYSFELGRKVSSL